LDVGGDGIDLVYNHLNRGTQSVDGASDASN
jgi:hypothetical protein